MKNGFLFLFSLWLFACSNKKSNNSLLVNNDRNHMNNDSTFKVIDSLYLNSCLFTSYEDTVYDCHMCSGLIICESLNKCEHLDYSFKDTLFLGKWGQPSIFKHVENFIFFESIWMSGDVTEYSVIVYDVDSCSGLNLVHQSLYTSSKYEYINDTTYLLEYDYITTINFDTLEIIVDSTYSFIDTNDSTVLVNKGEKEIKHFLNRKAYK